MKTCQKKQPVIVMILAELKIEIPADGAAEISIFPMICFEQGKTTRANYQRRFGLVENNPW